MKCVFCGKDYNEAYYKDRCPFCKRKLNKAENTKEKIWEALFSITSILIGLGFLAGCTLLIGYAGGLILFIVIGIIYMFSMIKGQKKKKELISLLFQKFREENEISSIYPIFFKSIELEKNTRNTISEDENKSLFGLY